jgi:phosphoribosyl 1,2-cyclic phosphodiesterase
MIAIACQSGSNGNCVFVEAGATRLLVDAGLSGKQVLRRLGSRGRGAEGLCAVLVSHDHADHVRCAGVYARKWRVPLYVTARTLEAARARCDLGRVDDIRLFEAGDAFDVGDVRVETVPTPHDGADGVAFAFEHGGRRVGVLTDLGHPFDGLGRVIASLDGVFLESNHDPHMLATGPYPAFLKRRIAGPRGHISNHEAAQLLLDAVERGGRLRWACLAHLSAENNTPELALETSRRVLGERLKVFAASRYEASDVFEV